MGIRGMMWVQGYKVGMRVRGGYKRHKVGMRWV